MLTINTNVSSLNAQRALTKNNNALNLSFQRLSTGLRINSAKDDSAGLAITNKLTAQIRGLNQAVRNANDAISLSQTAESAINEQQNMLQRLRELAVQSASDTNTNADRQAIQLEADALISEIDRIAMQTKFNDRKLLDGGLSNVKFQVGAYENETVTLNIPSNRTFGLGSMYTATTSTVSTSALATDDLILNGVSIRATTTDDDSVSFSGTDASAIAKAAVINESTSSHGVTAQVNSTTLDVALGGAATFVTGDLEINGVAVSPVAVADGTDSDNAFRNAINAISSLTGVTATVSGSTLTLTAADGRNIVVSGNDVNGNTDTIGFTTGTFTASLFLKSQDTINVTGNTESAVGLADNTTVTSLRAVNVDTLSFTTQSGATTAIDVLDDAISSLSERQAALGAILNRMDAAISQLSAASENTSAARSRIRDADFAAETAAFSKNQILQQASSAILAQANVSTQIALSLLGN